jgi:hypothetical protein
MKSAAMSGFPYLTQAVRDLAWACFSPELLHSWQLADDGQNVAHCGLSLTPARTDWLNKLDRQPGVLLEQLAKKPGKRLGIYFEQLWQFFLEQDSDVDLVAHNLAVRDHGRTLGEFDIVYWCHQRQRHYHLELAVKFYLGKRLHTTVETRSQWQEWLGPNSRDRLNLKLDQLLQRQIRLTEQPEARDCLAALGVIDPVPEMAIKGYLFQSPLDPLPPPFGYNSRCPMQRWFPLGEAGKQLGKMPAEHYLLPEKARWLSPVQAHAKDALLSRPELMERLQSLLTASPRAQLIAATDTAGAEVCRFFVTPDDWPATAQNNRLREKP